MQMITFGQYRMTFRSTYRYPLRAQVKSEGLANFPGKLIKLSGPERGQVQQAGGGVVDNSEHHIELARLAFKCRLISNLSRDASYPPTEGAD